MTPGGQAQIGNVDLVKQLNSAAVYRLIDQYGPISRIQIAEQSQLAPASVTKITRQLIERGLIKEVDQQASTGGRRAISIVTETRNFHAIGVRLGRHDATITLFDLSSKVLAEEHYPLPERTQQTLEHALLNAIAQFIDSYQRKLRELIAISVILPGLVDPDSGKIHYMPHIQVENWGLVEALEERFKVTCFVGHDIRSLALAEHYFGASQDCEDSILVRVHRGTGAGIISNGRIFIGRNGNVGEIGHIQVEPLGERCHCGNFGCLETIAANAAIEQRVLNLLKQGYQSRVPLDDCTIKTICKAANKGDSLASEVNRAQINLPEGSNVGPFGYNTSFPSIIVCAVILEITVFLISVNVICKPVKHHEKRWHTRQLALVVNDRFQEPLHKEGYSGYK